MIKQFTIGRGDECQVRITDQSQKVSRNHATLKIYKNGKMFITDSSSNGTWVNGVKISQNVDYPIKRGDSVSFAHAAELNWEQIPKTKNKVVLFSSIGLVVVGLIIGAYFIMMPKTNEDNPKNEVVKPLEDAEAKNGLKQEKLTQDSIKRADSTRIANEAIKKAQVNVNEKPEPKKKPEVKPLEQDSTKKRNKIILPTS